MSAFNLSIWRIRIVTSDVVSFFRPHDGHSYAAAAKQLDYPDDRRAALVAALRASNAETVSLDRLARPGSRLLDSFPITAFSAATDAARAQAFYRNQLGSKLVSGELCALMFEAGGTMLRIQKIKEVRPRWRVSDIADTLDELHNTGVHFEVYGPPGQDEKGIWTPRGSNTEVAGLRDPDGNILSLTRF